MAFQGSVLKCLINSSVYAITRRTCNCVVASMEFVRASSFPNKFFARAVSHTLASMTNIVGGTLHAWTAHPTMVHDALFPLLLSELMFHLSMSLLQASALGSQALWACSPAINVMDERLFRTDNDMEQLTKQLQQQAQVSSSATVSSSSPPSPYTVLIYEGGDILSALRSIVELRRIRPTMQAQQSVELHVLDNNAASTARHLLLLSIALDSRLSLRNRTEAFLEVYGNCLIQEKTQLYINERVCIPEPRG